MNRTIEPLTVISMTAVLIGGLFIAGCGNTMRGATQDTGNIAGKIAGAAETVDVKAALIADKRVDTSNLNVDTNTDTNTVLLKGTVPTATQRTLAEQIAREHAKGYRIVNQLTVAPAA